MCFPPTASDTAVGSGGPDGGTHSLGAEVDLQWELVQPHPSLGGPLCFLGPKRRAKYLKSGINQAAGQRLRPATWILRVGMLNFDGYSCRSCECIIHSGAKPTHARYSVRVALRPQALCRAPKKHCSLECQCLSTTACSLSKQITKLAAPYQPLRLSKSVFCWESCGHDAKHHQPRLHHPAVCMRERGTSRAKVDTWLAGLKACRESWAACAASGNKVVRLFVCVFAFL